MLPDDHSAALNTVILRITDQKLKRRWGYMIGDHPKIWATPKLVETFRNLADSFIENYCSVAINARVSRLEIVGWDGDQRALDVWDTAGLPLRQDIMYRWGLTHGTAYVIVQDDQIVINPADKCFAQADPDDWMKQAWAGKAWLNIDTGKWHATLWDETHLYRYVSRGNVPYTPGETLSMYTPTGADFQLDSVESHGYGDVPVIPITPFGFMAAPVIDQIAPIQDKINKMSANKFVTAEFTAFSQRVFFTRQQLDPYDVRQQPDHAIVLDPGDSEARASVQELGGHDLSVYDEAKEREVDALFTIAMLPRHLRANVNSHLSGEAMKTDEAPFVEALHDHQREFGQALSQAMNLLGIEAEPMWRNVEPRDEYRNAQTVKNLVDAGLPWQTAALEFMDLTPEQIEDAERILAEGESRRVSDIAAQTEEFLRNPFMDAEGNDLVTNGPDV